MTIIKGCLWSHYTAANCYILWANKIENISKEISLDTFEAMENAKNIHTAII